jgi:CheY-like chemotaxis protein
MICHIRNSAQDAAAIVSRLQQFYRPMDVKTEAQPIDLPSLVRETVESTRPRWHSVPQRSGTVVNVQLDLEAVPPVVGQPRDLRDALTNLLFNAVEAMPSGGVISISTRLEDDAVVLRVADNGVGMPPDSVEHCFEPFFLSKIKRGSGLGLPAVHGAVARHGGKISVQSELGRGTEFTIRFPLKGKPASALVEAAPKPLRKDAKTPFRVLVIDDEPAVRGVIQAMLSRNGHTVTLAPDGASGLKELESDTYNLIITDLGMPGMDGREVARRVKKLSPTLPVVLLTGWGQSAGSMEGMPIDAVLQKPVGMHDLLAVVENLARA